MLHICIYFAIIFLTKTTTGN